MPYDAQEPDGPPKFLRASLHACHGLMTPADLHILAKTDASVLPSAHVKTLGVAQLAFRSCTSTSGSAASPTACMILCVRFTCFVRSSLLRHRRNTRYGWMANPYPTGTCTLQDAPSFAWRANVPFTSRATNS